MYWFTRDWWRYLLSGIQFRNEWTGLWFWQHIRCRIQGHPCGVVWYTSSIATEPDMSCKYCGDDLG